MFSDFTTEGTTNHYYAANVVQPDFAAWFTAVSGTFSRSTSARLTNASGLEEAVTAGTLRFDHDPTTLAPLGVLLERSSTNLCLHSAFDSGWVTNAATLTANAGAAPDGTTTAALVNYTNAISGQVYPSANIAVSASSTYTMSLKLDPATASAVNLRLFNSSATQFVQVNYNLATLTATYTNTVGTNIVYVSSRCTPAENGFVRIEMTFTTSAGTTAVLPDLYAGGATGTLYLADAQLELGRFATSHIPTTTGSASRSQDALSLALATQTQMTRFLKFRTPPVFSGYQALYVADDGTLDNFVEASVGYGTANHLYIDVYSGGASQASLDMGALTGGTEYTLAFAAKAGSLRASLNGAAVQSATPASMPASLAAERLGCEVSAGAEWGGHIAQFVGWNGSFGTDAALQALT